MSVTVRDVTLAITVDVEQYHLEMYRVGCMLWEMHQEQVEYARQRSETQAEWERYRDDVQALMFGEAVLRARDAFWGQVPVVDDSE